MYFNSIYVQALQLLVIEFKVSPVVRRWQIELTLGVGLVVDMKLSCRTWPSRYLLEEPIFAEAPRLVVRRQHSVAGILNRLSIAIIFRQTERVPQAIRESFVRAKEGLPLADHDIGLIVRR